MNCDGASPLVPFFVIPLTTFWCAMRVIRVEQRLQDTPRFLLVPVDEGLAAALPIGFGLLTQHLVPGLFLSVLSFILWKRLKGEGGIPRFLALSYWYGPRELRLWKSLPDSGVSTWRG